MSQVYLQNLQIYDDAGVGRDSTGKILRVVNAPESTVLLTTSPVADAARTTAGASISGTLAAAVGVTTYVKGFRITAQPIAASVGGQITLTGLAGGKTFTYEFAALVGGLAQLTDDFEDGFPASAANTAIVLTVPALALATVSLNIWGYQK